MVRHTDMKRCHEGRSFYTHRSLEVGGLVPHTGPCWEAPELVRRQKEWEESTGERLYWVVWYPALGWLRWRNVGLMWESLTKDVTGVCALDSLICLCKLHLCVIYKNLLALGGQSSPLLTCHTRDPRCQSMENAENKKRQWAQYEYEILWWCLCREVRKAIPPPLYGFSRLSDCQYLSSRGEYFV